VGNYRAITAPEEKNSTTNVDKATNPFRAYFINSRTVVIGLTYPGIYRHIPLSSGITKIGVKTGRSIGF
jgi:hypothetical protein